MSKMVVDLIQDTQLSNKEEIWKLIEAENLAQIKKWGIQVKHPFDWFMWLAEEFGEFAQATIEMCYRNGSVEDFISEGIQMITLGMKMVSGVLSQIE